GFIAHVAANNTVSPPVGTVLGLWSVGGTPSGIEVGPGSGTVWFADAFSGNVFKFDTVTPGATPQLLFNTGGVFTNNVSLPDNNPAGPLRVTGRTLAGTGFVENRDPDTGAPVFPGDFFTPATDNLLADSDQQFGGNIFVSSQFAFRILVF